MAQRIDQGRLIAIGKKAMASCQKPLKGNYIAYKLGETPEHNLPPNQDLEVARRMAKTINGAELYLYSGDRHLFADDSLPDYDEQSATQLTKRVLRFLDDLASKPSRRRSPS